MTKNQIEYAKLRETQRANLASEELTRKRDTAARALGIDTLTESVRHNRAGEEQARLVLGETQRSNLAKEGETQRSNLAKESETMRSNLAKEAETHRASVVKEEETERHNKAAEAIDIGSAATRAAQVAETVRHNFAMEAKDLQPKVITTVTGSTVSPSTPVTVNVKPTTSPSSSTNILPVAEPTTLIRGFGGRRGEPKEDFKIVKNDDGSVETWVRDPNTGLWNKKNKE